MSQTTPDNLSGASQARLPAFSTKGGCMQIVALRGNNQDAGEWKLTNKAVSAQTCADALLNLPSYCYAFLSKADYPREGEGRESVLAHFGVPSFVANRTCFELNGFAGCQAAYAGQSGNIDSVRGETGRGGGEDAEVVTGCTTWFRCLFKMIEKIPADASEDGPEYCHTAKKGYQWYEMTVFCRWDSGVRCQILCVDVPFDFAMGLKKGLEARREPLNLGDPFAMQTAVWDRIVVYYDISVWRVRDPVRMLEKAAVYTRDVFRAPHDHMRHAIHVSEVLESAISTAREMHRYRSEIYSELPQNVLGRSHKRPANEYAAFQISTLQNLKLRSDSNRARLGQEINYVFNNLALQDSYFIKSITLLTMVFLPATFISGLFSTTFFSYGQVQWEISDQLWIYWTTVVPITTTVLVVWYLWLYKVGFVLKLSGRFGAWCMGTAKSSARTRTMQWRRQDGSKDTEAGSL